MSYDGTQFLRSTEVHVVNIGAVVDVEWWWQRNADESKIKALVGKAAGTFFKIVDKQEGKEQKVE